MGGCWPDRDRVDGGSRRLPGPAVRRLCGGLAATVVLATGAAGCGEGSYPPAYRATAAYLKALAAGDDTNACADLDRQARASLGRHLGRRSSCARALRLCTPDRIQVGGQDPTQLLYATIDVDVNGSTAVARVHGTRVADAIRRVSLVKAGRRWQLSSYGQRLVRCPGRSGPSRHPPAHRS